MRKINLMTHHFSLYSASHLLRSSICSSQLMSTPAMLSKNDLKCCSYESCSSLSKQKKQGHLDEHYR